MISCKEEMSSSLKLCILVRLEDEGIIGAESGDTAPASCLGCYWGRLELADQVVEELVTVQLLS